MSEYALSPASRRQVKSIFSELSSESFKFQNILTMNHHDIF